MDTFANVGTNGADGCRLSQHCSTALPKCVISRDVRLSESSISACWYRPDVCPAPPNDFARFGSNSPTTLLSAESADEPHVQLPDPRPSPRCDVSSQPPRATAWSWTSGWSSECAQSQKMCENILHRRRNLHMFVIVLGMVSTSHSMRRCGNGTQIRTNVL